MARYDFYAFKRSLAFRFSVEGAKGGLSPQKPRSILNLLQKLKKIPKVFFWGVLVIILV